MARTLLKYSEWQSSTGKYYCNDISDLEQGSGYWWLPARMLNLTPAAYVEWLYNTYKPDNIRFNGKTLIYSWNKEHYNSVHSFVLYINREARKRKFYI